MRECEKKQSIQSKFNSSFCILFQKIWFSIHTGNSFENEFQPFNSRMLWFKDNKIEILWKCKQNFHFNLENWTEWQDIFYYEIKNINE